MKTAIIAAALTLAASVADAYTSTRCFWIGSTYTCTTTGSGGVSTVRCFTIGNTVQCTGY